MFGASKQSFDSSKIFLFLNEAVENQRFSGRQKIEDSPGLITKILQHLRFFDGFFSEKKVEMVIDHIYESANG